MRKIDFTGIDLQDIQLFVLGAELLNFSDVARLQYISQSVVSKRIANLEAHTDLILFTKNKGRLQLTPAGKELYLRLSGLLGSVEFAFSEAHRVQLGQDACLHIGFPDVTDSPSVLLRVQKLLEKFPEAQASIDVYYFSALRNKLVAGELDVIFTSLFESDYLVSADVEWKLLRSFPTCVFVSNDNPLSKYETIQITDLKYEKFILYSPFVVPGYVKMAYDICESGGFQPQISRYVDNICSMALSLMLNEGIVLGDKLMSGNFSSNVKCFELTGFPAGQIVAWNKNSMDSIINHFLTICFEEK